MSLTYPPHKIPVLFFVGDKVMSGWRDRSKYLVLSRGEPVEIPMPDAWSAIGDGRGTDCEKFSLSEF